MKKVLGIVMALLLCVGLLPTSVAAAEETRSLMYLDENGTKQNCTATVLNVTDWAEVGGDKPVWYVVETTNVQRVTVRGDVNLVLKDSETIYFHANVKAGGSLTIYSQSTGDQMGKIKCISQWVQQEGGGLWATEENSTITINGGNIVCQGNRIGEWNRAGLATNGGSIVINGGNVEATTNDAYSPAIAVRAGGSLTINGGTVNASTYNGDKRNSWRGAGIQVDSTSNLTIDGGTVTANAGNYGAAIGGNAGEASGTITINGGTVTATTNDIGRGAAIGGGGNEWSADKGGACGNITVTGGRVTATSQSGAGIGSGGQNGAAYNGSKPTIKISGAIVEVESSEGYAIGDSQDQNAVTKTISDSIVEQWDKRTRKGSEHSYQVYGSYTLKQNYVIQKGKILTIPKGTTLTVAKGAKLTVAGELDIQGTLTKNGTIQFQTPEAGKGFTIDYNNETITIQSGYEVSSSSNFSNTLSSGAGITPGATYYVRRAKSGQIDASGAVENTLASRPTATVPTLSRTDTTITVTNVKSGQKYKLGERGDWQDEGSFSGLTANTPYTVYTYVAATDSAFKSESVPAGVTTKSAPAAFGGTVEATVTADSITLTQNDAWEYSQDEASWNDVYSYTNLQAGTQYEFYVRVKETETEMPSQSQKITVYTAFATPTTGEGYTIDYANETVQADTGYELKQGEGWTRSSISIAPGDTICVRKAERGSIPASTETENTLPGRPQAPELELNHSDEGVQLSNAYKYNFEAADYTKEQETGNGTVVKVEPGKTIYIYTVATETAFKSDFKTIMAPSRGTTPAVAIDYENETLNTTAAMEYKVGNGQWTVCTANMAAADFQWNGSQNVVVQLRTKATGENYASEVQSPLTISARPATPDAPEVTAATASSITVNAVPGQEYSLDKSTWQDGGLFESLNHATKYTVYTRVKAVAGTSFASEVSSGTEAYTAFATPTTGEGYTIDYVTEKIAVADGYEVSRTESFGTTLTDGTIATGTYYVRKAEQSRENDMKIPASVAVSFQVERYATPTGTEACSISTETEKITITEGYEVSKDQSFQDASKAVTNGEVIQAEESLYARRKSDASHFASYVQTITAPSRGQAAGVGLNYAGETLGTTDKMEYKIGENGWQDCEATMSLAAFGWVDETAVTVQFRIKHTETHYAGPIESVTIPTRIGAPAFTLDNNAEAVTIPAGYYYNRESGAYNSDEWTAGTGEAVTVAPGGAIYIYKAAVTEGENKAFKSQVQTITAPSRGTTPAVAIDYYNETLSTTAAMEYKLGNGQWTDCTANMAATAFQWDGSQDVVVQLRTKATGENYASEVQSPLTISARPAAPGLSYDPYQEQVTISSGSYYYGSNGAYDGEGWAQTSESVSLAPGNTMYFYIPAGDNTFKSQIQTLTAPARGQAPDISINYANETLNTSDLMEYSTDGTTWTACGEAMDISGWLPDGATLYIRYSATESDPVSNQAEVVIPQRPGVPQGTMELTKSQNSIILNNLEDFIGCEFSLDGTNWNASGSFDGLEAGRVYSIHVRQKATTEKFHSLEKNLDVTTVKADGSTELVSGETVQQGETTISRENDEITIVTGNTTITVTLPENGTAGTRGDGKVELPENTKLTTDQGHEMTLPDGGQVDKDGNVTLAGGGTLEIGDNTVTMPESGGTVTPKGDGKVELPGGATVSNQGQSVTLPEGGGSLTPDSGIVSYTVTFQRQDGSDASLVTIANGEKIGAPTDPVRTGYLFGGWYREAGCENAWSFSEDQVTGNLTLYARWNLCDHKGNQNETSCTQDTVCSLCSGSVSPTGHRYVNFVCQNCGEEKPDPTEHYPDVNKTAWYYEDVRFAMDESLMIGYDDGSFQPEGLLTRAEMAQILYNRAGRPSVVYEAHFSDVQEKDWFAPAVIWAAQNRIVNGLGDGTFAPNEPVTRQQLAQMLYRWNNGVGARASLRRFHDADQIMDCHREAIAWAVGQGILQGDTENSKGELLLRPQDGAKRCEVAAVLRRYFE